MALRTRSLSPAALAVLREATVVGTEVRLPNRQLERALYVEVNDALERIGGRWKGGKVRAHAFPTDPTDALAAILDDGVAPVKNADAFFPTPQQIVRRMLRATDILTDPERGWSVLEPSAGTGAIIDGLRAVAPNARVTAVESNAQRAALLRGKGITVHEADFLAWTSGWDFEVVLMNPPFAVPGWPRAYIAHIERAWRLVTPGGSLVAIAPAGLAQNAMSDVQRLRELVQRVGRLVPLGPQAFEDSGTDVHTVMVVMRKPECRHE
jgi:phospholipid N-methyltransferase